MPTKGTAANAHIVSQLNVVSRKASLTVRCIARSSYVIRTSRPPVKNVKIAAMKNARQSLLPSAMSTSAGRIIAADRIASMRPSANRIGR